MKKVTFKKLTITNFKGIESLEVNFSDDTKIKGENGSGKSTVFDALNWCLFGKNSADRTAFGIKNTVNTSLNRAEHIVELQMTVNDEDITARRIYKEIWQKKRGTENTEFSGNETLYFWNKVPCTQKEYQVKVANIVEESIFKMVTSPTYFNSMKESERRDILIRMAGDVSNEKVINGTAVYQDLFARIKGQKTLEEYRKEISFQKLELVKQLGTKDRKGEISIRIDEILKNNPPVEDWAGIEAEIAEKQASINAIEKEITDLTSTLQASSNESIRIHNEVQQAKREMDRIEMKLRGEAENEASRANMAINQAQFELTTVRNNISNLKSQKISLQEEITTATKQLEDLRTNWQTVNASEFHMDSNDCICPTCKRELETSDIEKTRAEMQQRFSEAKAKNLDAVNSKGIALKDSITKRDDRLLNLSAQITSLAIKEEELLVLASTEKQLPLDYTATLESHTEYQSMKKITEQTVPVVASIDISEQKGMKEAIQEGIDSLRATLSGKAVIEKNAARVKELIAQEKDYAKQLAELEKIEFTIDSFNRARMEMIEKIINSRFKIVNFKLSYFQVDGTEVPCCITTVGGVEYSDLNHAGQLNAGIDCCSAIAETFGISAPIVVDNAESCTSFIPTTSQTIRLYVTKDPVLTIN